MLEGCEGSPVEVCGVLGGGVEEVVEERELMISLTELLDVTLEPMTLATLLMTLEAGRGGAGLCGGAHSQDGRPVAVLSYARSLPSNFFLDVRAFSAQVRAAGLEERGGERYRWIRAVSGRKMGDE